MRHNRHCPQPGATFGENALKLLGVEMAVSLDNRLRSHDTQVILFALPLSIDPRGAYPKNQRPGFTRAYVTVKPAAAGLVFRPRDAVLRIGERQFGGQAGFDFGLWSARGERVAAGGRWDHRPVGSEFVLADAGRIYYLSIDFETPPPPPQSRDIALDLGRALTAAGHSVVPLVRFAPVRWKEGYT